MKCNFQLYFCEVMPMATTRIEPVHPNKAWGAAQTIKRMTDYFKNPAKTDDGRLVSGFEVDTDIIIEDFMMARDEYKFKTGRDQGENEVLAYHVRQAFSPGEVDADTAHRLGHELAMELTGGNYSFMVCTHIDKSHVHNHITINAVNLDCDGKFRNELHSFRKVRRMADRISADNNLSVVDSPALSKGTKNRYTTPTKRDELVGIIDDVLATGQLKNFDDFLKHLAKAGCKVKQLGKTISIQPPKAERFFRLKSGKKGLPVGYDEESLRNKIAEMQIDIPAELHDSREEILTAADAKTTPATDALPVQKAVAPIPTEQIKPSHDKKINLIIDLENSIKAQESHGYAKWAKGFNLQQAAETLLFLQTNNLTDMDALTHAAAVAKSDYDSLQNRIDTASTRINAVNTLQKHIGAYNKNRDVYSQYLRSKRNPQFRQDNEKAIATIEEAKAYFDSLGLEKLPTIKELREEYSTLSQEKHNCQQAKNEMKQYVFDLQSAKQNAEMLLGIDGEPAAEQTKSKGQIDVR